MNVLICCEYSGIVRNAFTAAGHYAVSCDILPSESPGLHFQGDCIPLLYNMRWDLVIAHPPCTYLCKAQLFRCVPDSIYADLQKDAIDFFLAIWNSPQLCIAIENPIGALSRMFRPPDQIIYPWYFGDPHSKDICLWLKNVPPLISTCYSTRRQPVKNHTNGRMSQAQRSKIKSRFFPAIAEAMANQWTENHLYSSNFDR